MGSPLSCVSRQNSLGTVGILQAAAANMDGSSSVAKEPKVSDARSARWLDGEVLACVCPDCGGPMSVRLWLMTADCWSCGTSIELTEEDVHSLRVGPRNPPAEPKRAVTDQRVLDRTGTPPLHEPGKSGLFLPPVPAERKAVRSKHWVEPPAVDEHPAEKPPLLVAIPPLAAAGKSKSWPDASAPTGPKRLPRQASWLDWLSTLPAWLLSMLLHLLAMIVLGLLTMEYDDDQFITLAVTIGAQDEEGADAGENDPQAVEFDKPGLTDEVREQQYQEMIEARQIAQELSKGHQRPLGDLRTRDEILQTLVMPGEERMFEGRDPRVRSQVLEHEGGTTYTEAAVARGLKWLARHQNSNGSWSLNGFCWAGDCEGRCDGLGDESDMAATSLALLPFLGAGQTHESGIYRKAVREGLQWMIARQHYDGDLRGDGIGRMYAHGQAAIVLCEAFAVSRDESLRMPAQLAIDYIVEAQHRNGGWRYKPGQRGDTSVFGWQLMALQSARMAGLEVPESTLRLASGFLDDVQGDSMGTIYAYQRGHRPTPTMTAEALLCRQYLGWGQHHPSFKLAAEYFARAQLPSPDEPNIYLWYYASQFLHHLGGRPWDRWNENLRATLVAMQEEYGHAAGSWAPAGSSGGANDTQSGGRIYMTSLAICTLEVYYRHLPLFRSINVGR